MTVTEHTAVEDRQRKTHEGRCALLMAFAFQNCTLTTREVYALTLAAITGIPA